MNVLKVLCGLRGRVKRGPYWLALIALWVASFIAGMLSGRDVLPLVPFLTWLGLTAYVWLLVCAGRARDAGQSAGVALLTLVPLVGLVITIVLGCQGSKPDGAEPTPSVDRRAG